LFFYSGKVCHVYPLYGFLSRCGRVAEVEAVVFAHGLDVLQGFDLLCHFFAQADACFGHRTGQVAQVFLFGFDEAVDTVQCQTAVVTDDTSACIVVGKSGEEAQ